MAIHISAIGLVSTLLVALVVIARFAWRRVRWRRITVFLSYRVATDQALVEQLYNRLLRHKLSVWWDVRCLEPGRDFEEGFADGVFASSVFVPIVSKGALAPYATMVPSSRCDNALLEHVLALELQKRGKIKAIYPIFVGEPVGGRVN